MFCKNCGSSSADQDEFCARCGGSLKRGADAIPPHSEFPLGRHRATVDAADRTDTRVRLGIFIVIGSGLVLLCVVIALIPDSNVSQPAPISKGPDYSELPRRTAESKAAESGVPVIVARGPAVSTASHQQRLVALREKQEAATMAIEIEREAISETVKRDGIEGVPEDEHEHVQRLIQEKESIDAAIKEEEGQSGSEPMPSAPTVIQTLAHHQVGEAFSVGYWTYLCSTTRWSELVGNGRSRMGRPDAAFAVVHLMMRNDDDSASLIPPLRLVDLGGREYEPSPKAVLQRDALDLSAQLHAKGSADGSVIFDVPRGGIYFLRVSGGMMSSKGALIDLAPLR